MKPSSPQEIYGTGSLKFQNLGYWYLDFEEWIGTGTCVGCCPSPQKSMCIKISSADFDILALMYFLSIHTLVILRQRFQHGIANLWFFLYRAPVTPRINLIWISARVQWGSRMYPRLYLYSGVPPPMNTKHTHTSITQLLCGCRAYLPHRLHNVPGYGTVAMLVDWADREQPEMSIHWVWSSYRAWKWLASDESSEP